MRQLILFLSKYRNTLLLIVLFGLAIFRHSTKNPVAEHSFNKLGFGTMGMLHNTLYGWKYYWNLRDINEELARENAALLSSSTVAPPPEFTKTEGYNFIPARAISYSYHKHSNYIILNAGKRHGVHEGMGVISKGNWVGTVNEVSNYYASVIPIIHELGSIGARIDGKGLGRLEWGSQSPSLARLVDVQREFQPETGDSVYSFTRASIAPPALVGTVRSARQNPEDLSWTAEVELAIDYSNLDWVYLCAPVHGDSLDSLNTGNQ
ncbi:MAG: rod shape-determining protein MreC [Bacteroidota bacterium]|jgi:rod shape-determining protein MreC